MLREARQLALFGIDVSEPLLDYPRLLARAGEVVRHIRDHSIRREQVERVGETIHEKSGTAHFVDAHTVETESGLRLQVDKIILSAGGTSRACHSWLRVDRHAQRRLGPHCSASLDDCRGSGRNRCTGRLHLPGLRHPGPALPSRPPSRSTEDEDVGAAVAAAFRESGMVVHENFGTIESFEKTPKGVRMVFSKDGVRASAEASLAIMAAAGWRHGRAESRGGGRGDESAGLYTRRPIPANLRASCLRRRDITGRLMLVPQGVQDGFVAATDAVRAQVWRWAIR